MALKMMLRLLSQPGQFSVTLSWEAARTTAHVACREQAAQGILTTLCLVEYLDSQ